MPRSSFIPGDEEDGSQGKALTTANNHTFTRLLFVFGRFTSILNFPVAKLCTTGKILTVWGLKYTYGHK